MNTSGKNKITPSHALFMATVALDQKDFPRPWKLEDWNNLNWDHHILLGTFHEGDLVGFVLFARAPHDDTAHLLKICLASNLRGSGLAKEFWNDCLEEIKSEGVKSVYLEVEAHNQRAVAFYQKVNFHQLRHIKSYYSDGADALIMQLTL